MVLGRLLSESTLEKGRVLPSNVDERDDTNIPFSDQENIAIMHAFVDLLDLSNMPFIDALRSFLQAFRLPGESQKIDRFMLKFAERYIAGNPTTSFANAGTNQPSAVDGHRILIFSRRIDTPYVLAFSTIMLNTDAHSRQIKVRMTKQGFIANNRGINDGEDLPEDFLTAIYDDIVNNEIRMKDEIEAPTVITPGPGIAGVLATVGRDLQKEQYMLQSNNMANKTEVRIDFHRMWNDRLIRRA